MRPESRPAVTFVRHEVDMQEVLRSRDLLYVRLPPRLPAPPLQGRPLLRARLAGLGARLDLVALAAVLAALLLWGSRQVVL